MENLGEQFLKGKYPKLPEDKPVARAVKKAGEELPVEKGEKRIETFLNRLERLALDRENKQRKKPTGDIERTNRPRALGLLREMVMNKYVRPHKAKMAEGATRMEEGIDREMGVRQQYNLEERGEKAVGDLESSLDQWINYLSDPEEPYPTWFRYYAFRNILNMGEYDKDKQKFPRRSPGTFKLFPDVDRGALAYVQEMIEASKDKKILSRLQEAQAELDVPMSERLTREKVRAFAELSFARQYAEGMRQAGEITPELREETRGEWIKYSWKSDPKALWLSLQNKGTAWCTKGYPTAKTQLQGGDFYVYYSLDKQGMPTIPRIAIRMEGQNKIAENPRGVLDSKQNVEGNMIDILKNKLDELKETGVAVDEFKKKSDDMRQLTQIEQKIKDNKELTRKELTFLYEIDEKIQGFGYEEDPRIAEIRDTRDSEKDMLTVFDCQLNEIALTKEKIDQNTKAYIGELFPGIFKSWDDPECKLRHIATSFPEGLIRKKQIEIGSQDEAQIRQELGKQNIWVSDWASDILSKTKFSPEKMHLDLAELTVADLGFSSGATTEEIFTRAKELGLYLCPAEVGPQLRLQDKRQDYRLIAMEPIVDFDGDPGVFSLYWDGGRLELDADCAEPGRPWASGLPWVFSTRK